MLAQRNLRGLAGLKARLPFADLQAADLTDAVLAEALLDGADLTSAVLTGTTLTGASLRDTHLTSANMRGCRLERSNLQGANLEGAILDGAYLFGAMLGERCNTFDVEWGQPGEVLSGEYSHAASVFRHLFRHFQNQSNYQLADSFYYKEMEAVRLLAARGGLSLIGLRWTLHKWIWGYGVRPSRVFLWMLATILLFGALVFPTTGIRGPDGISFSTWDGLALSVVTFATLGYGNRTPATLLGELLGGAEALSGSLLMSLFLVALATRYIRR